MPSSATITSFYVFSPYTKARAIHLNANFSNFRGHIIPTSPSQGDGSDQEYDLGSTEYRWNYAYLSGINLSISSGSSHVLSGTTDGGFKFTKGETTTFSVLDSYFQGQNATPMEQTSSASIGDIAKSAAINSNFINTTIITSSSIYIESTGRPIFIGLKAVENTSGASGLFFDPFYYVSASSSFVVKLSFNVDSVKYEMEITTDEVAFGADTYCVFSYCPTNFNIIHFPETAGTYNIYLSASISHSVGSATSAYFSNVKLIAYEL